MMESRKLEITLKSDLCVGSGYSYAGIIDSDVCYDDCGLPYIPAKRLKGCMREAAELIGISEHEIERLFGKGGEHAFNENSEKVLSGLILSNAYIMDYEKIKKAYDCMYDGNTVVSVFRYYHLCSRKENRRKGGTVWSIIQ